MVKTILSQVKEYKRVSILTPVCMLGEVIMEMIVPLLMASIIDKGVSAGDIHHIKVTGLIMLLMAAISLTLGILSARFGARPPPVWPRTCGRPCSRRSRPSRSPTSTSSAPPASSPG